MFFENQFRAVGVNRSLICITWHDTAKEAVAFICTFEMGYVFRPNGKLLVQLGGLPDEPKLAPSSESTLPVR